MGENTENTPELKNNEQVTNLSDHSDIILSTEPIHLSAVVFMKPDLFEIISGWNDEFQQMYPNTTIELTNMTYEQSYLYYKEQAKLDQSSDIMLLDNTWISEFAARGYLSYRANEFNTSEQTPTYIQALAQTEWNGHTWAVPHSIDPYIVVWNPRIVKNETGESALPESLDEWLLLQDELLLNNPHYEGIHINTDDSMAFVSLLWALHGQWSVEIDGMYTLDTDNDIDILDNLMSSASIDIKDGITKPLLHTQSTSTDEYWEMFENNQFGAMVVPLSEWMTRNTGTEAISMSLLGGNSREAGLWLSGTSYAVSSKSQHQEMAYSWITWMTNLSHQLQMMNMDNKLPVSLTTLDSNNLLSFPQPELMKKIVEKGRAWNQDPLLTLKMNVLQQLIKEITHDPSLINQWNTRSEQLWETYKSTITP
jgi:ABC-type glycerol-3-phosphate transport system substrate-binding protein